MAIRKSRSDSFLKDETAAFSLLCVLSLQLLLQRITRAAFQLMHADREQLGFSRLGADLERAKRRRRCSKQAAGEHTAESVAGRVYTLKDVLTSTRSVMKDLWALLASNVRETLWCVATSYWPPEKGSSEMFEMLTNDTLKTIAALKFRITMRFDFPPLSLLGLRVATHERGPAPASGGQPQEVEEIDPRVQGFMQTSSCCLDPFWGRVVQDALREEVAVTEALADHVNSWEKHTRAVSVREEKEHALQRKLASGYVARPRTFHHQAAGMVLSSAAGHFHARGGRSLKSPDPVVQKAMALVRKKRVIHARPKQFGSGMFLFVSAKLKANSGTTREHWRAVWKGMNDGERSGWVARHRMAVATRRAQQKQQSEHAKSKEPVVSSPWNLGDDRFPLTTAWVHQFLARFSSREQGRAELAKLGIPDALKVLDARKYHSKGATEAYCKARLGGMLDEQRANSGTWPAVSECEDPPDACFNLHPGLCQKNDADVLKNMAPFMGRLPKRSTVLKFERDGCRANQKAAVFVRTVLGQASFSISQ